MIRSLLNRFESKSARERQDAADSFSLILALIAVVVIAVVGQ